MAFRGFESVDVVCTDDVEPVFSVTTYFDFDTEKEADRFFSLFSEGSEIGKAIIDFANRLGGSDDYSR